MNKTRFIAVALVLMVLPSCGLLQSALRIPGSILSTAGRTVGMPVSHQEEAEVQPPLRVKEGEIDQLD